jgi:hypothetical protein
MLCIIHDHIPLSEWLGHMSLFHANVQISNESTLTLLITMVLEACASFSCCNNAALVPQHKKEDGADGTGAFSDRLRVA